MKVKRTICPSCGSEEREVSEKENIHEYSEEIISESCGKPECRNSPEEKLLKGIYGDRNEE